MPTKKATTSKRVSSKTAKSSKTLKKPKVNTVPTAQPTTQGGVPKHHKVLRDNIQGITKNALARLLHRAGVKRISGLVYEDLRQRLKLRLEDICRTAVGFTEHERRKTVMDKDIYATAEQMGETLVVGINKKAKSATSSFHKGPSTSHTVGSSQPSNPNAKPHKFKPGTVALREIRRQQKSTGLLIPKANFERIVREVTQDYHTDMRFQKEAILLIQVWVEDYIVHISEGANLLAIHAGRETVQPKDVQLVMFLRQNSKAC